MNHTQRIEEVARCHRDLTRRLAKAAIETYLALLVEEIAVGKWVEIPGIGKIQVVKEQGGGKLMSILPGGKRVQQTVGLRLRTKFRLADQMKKSCYD
ncbi:MAG: HU family DNA-binding protein [Anaerolineae bacterium]|nr:HU family DNA-binding protein [Anaerolineae bacterium]